MNTFTHSREEDETKEKGEKAAKQSVLSAVNSLFDLRLWVSVCVCVCGSLGVTASAQRGQSLIKAIYNLSKICINI